MSVVASPSGLGKYLFNNFLFGIYHFLCLLKFQILQRMNDIDSPHYNQATSSIQ